MRLVLRTNRTKLQIVKHQMQFVLQVNAALHILIRVLLQGGQFELDAFLVLQERTDIVNDSFDVIDRLL